MGEIDHIWMDDQDGLIIVGDVLAGLKHLDDNSMEAIVTDPPYDLLQASRKGSGRSNNPDNPAGRHGTKTGGFMGMAWDATGVAFDPKTWEACLRVLKPGGHMVVFGGTRTHHRTWCAIEDAGFEVRDMLAWMYGQGFPKSLNVGKAIDKAAGRLLGGQSVVALKKRLIGLFDASGKSRQAIDSECGFRACNYLTLPGDNKRPDPWINVLPSQDKWWRIKTVLGCGEDVSAELDELFREATREVIGRETKARAVGSKSALPALGAATEYQTWDITAPATDEAKQWDGWGTALKPACEPILLARKPLSEPTVAANVLKWGTGALNIDGTRIAGSPPAACKGTGWAAQDKKNAEQGYRPNQYYADQDGVNYRPDSKGRWPANVVLECTCDDPEPVPETAREREDEPSQTRRYTEEGATNIAATPGVRREGGGFVHEPDCPAGMLDAQKEGASRYFYCAKSSKKERTKYLTCNCETVKLCIWQKQDQNQNEQMDSMSHEQGIFEESLTDASLCSTLPSGNRLMGQSQKDTPSTTKIRTNKTTDSVISASSLPPSTKGFMEDVNNETGNGGNPAKFVGNSFSSIPGTFICPPKDGLFTGVVVNATSPLWLGINDCAACGSAVKQTSHPTQKPLALMRWLIRMVTPPGGYVLDPFCGSGSTLVAAVEEGHGFVGIDLDPEYCATAQRRVQQAEVACD